MTEELTTHEQLAKEVDSQLLAAVKEKPTAAMLSVATKRLKDLGFTKIATKDDPAQSMAAELGLQQDPNVIKMPGVDNEPDAATA